MFKQARNILLLGTLLLLVTGCTAIAPAAPQATATPQVILITTTPVYVVVTATGEPTLAATDTPTAIPETATPTTVPTNTPVPATATPGAFDEKGAALNGSTSLTITSIVNTELGKARITWTSSDSPSSGFSIYYATSYKYPFYEGYPFYKISDGTTRVAYVDGTPGETYYYRICHVIANGCDYYSNSYEFTYPSGTPTP